MSERLDFNNVELENWRIEKINAICTTLANFFNYLSVPRPGFFEVRNGEEYVEMSYDTFSGTEVSSARMSVAPKITVEMTRYVLSEIYPCGSLLSGRFIPPEEIKAMMQKIIKRGIWNKNFLDSTNGYSLTIEEGVYELLWTYICNVCDIFIQKAKSLALNKKEDEKDNEDDMIKSVINNMSMDVFNSRNTDVNYGFDTDMENCAFQAILNILVSLSDSLETDTIDEEEIYFFYRLIFYGINTNEYPLEEREGDIKLKLLIEDCLSERGLYISDKACRLLFSILKYVHNMRGFMSNDLESEEFKIINRLMGFCQLV